MIAFTCCFITTFLMIGACGTTEWVMSEGFREGLFEQCILVNASLPVPFTKNDTERMEPKCYPAHPAGYVRASAALIIIVVFTDFFGTLLTGLGLRSTDPNKKYKYYRVASWALIVCSEAKKKPNWGGGGHHGKSGLFIPVSVSW